MWKYLLDANIVVQFQKGNSLAHLIAAAQSVRIAVVSDVFDELTIPEPRQVQTKWHKEVYEALPSSNIEVIPINTDSDEDTLRSTFLSMMNEGKKTTQLRNKGEAASTAVALHRPELIFVTEDANAVHHVKLYRELPGETGRIMGLHSFLRFLVEKNVLSSSDAKNVAEARQLATPVWWSTWLATI